jgi:hypothetical protein
MSAQSNEPDPSAQVWEHGWDDHQRQQIRRLAALPFSEKLRWLEEAHRLVLHLARQKSGGQSSSPTPNDPPTDAR